MITLEVHTEDEGTRLQRFRAARIAIGRSEANDVVLPHSRISRTHAEIVAQGDGRYVIRDLGSTGGSVLRRAEVEIPILPDGPELHLEEGDEVRFSSTECRVRVRSLSPTFRSGENLAEGTRMDEVPPSPLKRVPSTDLPKIETRVYADRLHLRRIVECDRQVGAATTIREALAAAVRQLAELYPRALYAAALDVDPAGDNCRTLASETRYPGADGLPARVSRTIAEMACESSGMLYRVEKGSRMVAGNGISRELTRRILREEDTSGICAPVVVDETPRYFLQLESRIPDLEFTESDLDLLMILANRVGARIANLQTIEQLARQRQMAMIGVVAECIAHDFGNVVNRIVVPAGLIREGFWREMSEQQLEETLSTLAYGASLAKARCEDFLGIHHAGRPRPLDLAGVVLDVAADCEKIFGARITFSVTAEDDAPPVVGDEGKLSRVFWNLFDNAYKVIRDRDGEHLTLEVEIRPRGRFVECLVRDDIAGGIPTEDLERFLALRDEILSLSADDTELIPILLRRIDDASVRRKQGQGVGSFFLCMTVGGMGGNLDVETGESGTCFTLRFPAAGGSGSD